MNITNLDELKSNINKSTLLIFLVIFTGAILGLTVVHGKFIQKQHLLDKQALVSAGNNYKSNLSEKLSILASSTVFLDYLRSGELTRSRLFSQFLAQISSLKSSSISAMTLSDLSGKVIFEYGHKTPHFLSLDLCYLNQSLDADMGDCSFRWKLFFKQNSLLKEILAINHAIKPCDTCESYALIEGKDFGHFKIHNHSGFKFKIGISSKKDYLFYIYFILIFIALTLFAIWSWFRLNRLLDTYIATPLKTITISLKENKDLLGLNQIDEIQYLINEINIWKSTLNKIQSDENLRKLGKITAQLAHDVRSPLAVIDMLIQDLKHPSASYKSTLEHATQRISDIANNFLSQYSSPHTIIANDSLANTYIAPILESMVSEKRSQYRHLSIEIMLNIDSNGWRIFSCIEVIAFKRLLSNLINNAIEAISNSGYVSIKLFKIKECLRIEICDNGCGIADDILPKIIKGGVSIGKVGGVGLGLSHAIKTIEDWNGDIDIKSILGQGTQIGINLPLAKTNPDWVQTELTIPPNTILCILDDEKTTHLLWNKRLQDFQKQIVLKHIYQESQLPKLIHSEPRTERLYLIDYDLGEGLNGLETICKYQLQVSSFLVTNHYDDPHVLNKAMELGIKIIPKCLILHLPIYTQ